MSGWLLAVGGVAVAATVVACQPSPSREPAAAGATPAPSTTTGRPTVTAPPAPPRCRTADLAVAVGQADSGTGRTGLNIALINRSTHRCRLYGFGGIQLLDAAGSAVPTEQLRRAQPAPRLITLGPGARAYSGLYWVSSPEAAPCPVPALLLVTPPDETTSIRASFTYRVCDQGRIQQTSYQLTPI